MEIFIKSKVKRGYVQKLAIDGKSTFFGPSSWHLVKTFIQQGNHFHKVSKEYDDNCGSFIGDHFSSVSSFF